MYPIEFSYTPADNDLNGYADDITGAGSTIGSNEEHISLWPQETSEWNAYG